MTNPIVIKLKPELYAKHTKHFSRADRLAYNYSVIDDYIKEYYHQKTLGQIASDLNEYEQRIAYRVQVLRYNKLLVGKREKRKLEYKAKEMERLAAKAKELMEFYNTTLGAIKSKLNEV